MRRMRHRATEPDEATGHATRTGGRAAAAITTRSSHRRVLRRRVLVASTSARGARSKPRSPTPRSISFGGEYGTVIVRAK
jgi:hypothetical protein